jgi:hypothetical protein
MKHRKIRTKARNGSRSATVEIGGWLCGKRTYLWLGLNGVCAGIVHTGKLYRLAKAIVRHVESER